MTSPTLPLALYRAAATVLEPLAPALLRRRAAAGKEDAARLGERLGRPSRPRPAGPVAWLHGVSVGESLSLLPLAQALAQARPGLTVLLTSGTAASGQVLGARLGPQFGGGVIHQYAPVDGPRAVAAFLDAWRPGLCVLAESELWPNLILGAKARGVPLALVSARITERTAAGWARLPQTARALFSAFDLILPQDAASAARAWAFGGRVGPELNLKLVGDAPPADEAALARVRAAIGGRRVVLANSTHPGEEAIIARAAAAAAPGALLVIAPRHPERGAEVAERLQAPRRARGAEPDAASAVYVADTLGELGLWIRLADAVVMGGSFVDGIGGHNPMETARIGRPILTGPHVANARSIYADLAARGAVLTPADEAELARDLEGVLGDRLIARRLAEAAQAYAARQGAALQAALTALAPLIPA